MPTNNHSDNLFDGQVPLDDEQLWDLLSLYVDGEADPAQAAIVEQMLSSDPAYRRDFDFLMASSKTMYMVEEVAPPARLREAVYAATARRSTLVGRLRAALGRATTPAFVRYATFGGAFAAAAIGVAMFWPRTSTMPPGDHGPASSVATAPQMPTHVATNESTHPHINNFTLDNAFKLPVKPTEPKIARYKQSPTRLNAVLEPHKDADMSGIKVVKATRTPHSYPVPKNNAPRPDSSLQVVSGYPYDKKMDNDKIHGYPETIVPSKADFGPMVVAINDETPTTSPDNGTQVNARQHSDPDVTAIPSPAPEPQKTRVRVAALPPADKQVLAEAVLRKNLSLRNEGYDRTIADNMQRHDGLTLYKSAF